MKIRSARLRAASLVVAAAALTVPEAHAQDTQRVDCLSYRPPQGWNPTGSKTGAAAVWKSPDVVTAGKVVHQPNFSIRLLPTDTDLETFKRQMDTLMGKQQDQMATMLKAQQSSDGASLDLGKMSKPKWTQRTYGAVKAYQVNVDSHIKMDGTTVPFAGRTVIARASGKIFLVSGGYPARHAKTLAKLSEAFLGSLDFKGCKAPPTAPTPRRK